MWKLVRWVLLNVRSLPHAHCELSVNGEGFLALSEAANPWDINIVHKMKWETRLLMFLRWEAKKRFVMPLKFWVMAVLLLIPFRKFRGANIVWQLLINLECVGGLQFNKQNKHNTKLSSFIIVQNGDQYQTIKRNECSEPITNKILEPHTLGTN